MLFQMGQLVMTSGISDRIAGDADFARLVRGSLRRHSLGDWGDLCEEDKRENNYSLKKEFRLLSSCGKKEDRVWIITEADRSATTILFPDEY